MVSAAGLISVTGILVSVHYLFPTRLFNRIALRTDLTAETGFVGVPEWKGILPVTRCTAFTDLRPAGKVLIDGRWIEARAAVGYITKNTPVTVVRRCLLRNPKNRLVRFISSNRRWTAFLRNTLHMGFSLYRVTLPLLIYVTVLGICHSDR